MSEKFEIDVSDDVTTTIFHIKPNLQDIKNAMGMALKFGDCKLRLWILEHRLELSNSEL